MAGVPVLDPVAALVVSGMVVQAGLNIGRDAMRDLADASSTETITSISAALERARAQGLSEVVGIGAVRGRKVGSRMIVDIDVRVDPYITVSAAHNAAERVRKAVLRDVPEAAEVKVHVSLGVPIAAMGGLDGTNAAVAGGAAAPRGSSSGDATGSTNGLGATTGSPVQANTRGVKGEPNALPSSLEAEASVREVVARVPEILSIAHFLCHYPNEHSVEQGLWIHIDVVVQPNLSGDSIREIVVRTQKALLALPHISKAGVHIEVAPTGVDPASISTAESESGRMLGETAPANDMDMTITHTVK